MAIKTISGTRSINHQWTLDIVNILILMWGILTFASLVLVGIAPDCQIYIYIIFHHPHCKILSKCKLKITCWKYQNLIMYYIIAVLQFPIRYINHCIDFIKCIKKEYDKQCKYFCKNQFSQTVWSSLWITVAFPHCQSSFFIINNITTAWPGVLWRQGISCCAIP